MTSTAEMMLSATDFDVTHVPLGEIITDAKVLKAGSRAYPLLSMTMHHGLVRQEDKFKKRIASRDLSQYKVVSNGQLVVGFPIDEGVLSFQMLVDAGIVSPAYGVWDLRNPNAVDRSYLEKYLRSPQAIGYYVAKLRGSTARRRSLPRAVFLAMPIPLPPVDKQRRIAVILDKADELRTKRRTTLAHCDALVDSMFHAMFSAADVRREKIGNLVKFKSGSFLPASGMVSTGGYSVYGGNGVNGKHDQYMFAERKLVIGRVGAYCGVVHVTVPKSWITDNALYAESIPASASLDYLATALRIANLNQYSSQSGQPLISGSRINQVEIALPSFELQEKFSERVSNIGRLKNRLQAQLTELDALFASLQHRAFNGEL
ncbi:restriction endonuclease subunit S [Arthrobacter oryzae]|uniref:restriction endonuclease subunit S n=1 Tax=Arthrobacter oryzae TaxID=409290 RepID=UPI00273BF570|nr:restriction endonuclease subunit S [Arthrobacter oryzae]WLQ05674.1 restriction endonuclease subunit S [Arthrobacter oryzae]